MRSTLTIESCPLQHAVASARHAEARSGLDALVEDDRVVRWGTQRALLNAAAMQKKWEQKVKHMLENELTPSVLTCEETIKRVGKLRELIAEWKEQPGQYAVPWHKVDGRSMREWMDEFDMASALLVASTAK